MEDRDIQAGQKEKSPAQTKLDNLIDADSRFIKRHDDWLKEKQRANPDGKTFSGDVVGREPKRSGEEIEAKKMMDQGNKLVSEYDRSVRTESSKKGKKSADILNELIGISDKAVQLYAAGKLLDTMAGKTPDISWGDAIQVMEKIPGSIDLADQLRDVVKNRLVTMGAIGQNESVDKLCDIFAKSAETPQERQSFEIAKAERAGSRDFIQGMQGKSIDMSSRNIQERMARLGVVVEEDVINQTIQETKLSSGREILWNFPILMTHLGRKLESDDREKVLGYALGMIESNYSRLPDHRINMQEFQIRERAGARALIGIFDHKKEQSYAAALAGQEQEGLSEQIWNRIKAINEKHRYRPDFESVVDADHKTMMDRKIDRETGERRVKEEQVLNLENIREQLETERRRGLLIDYENNEELRKTAETMLYKNPSLIETDREKTLEMITKVVADDEVINYAKQVMNELVYYLSNNDKDVAEVRNQRLEGERGFLGFGRTKDQIVTTLTASVENITRKIAALESEDNGKLDLQLRAKIEALKLLQKSGTRRFSKVVD